MTRIWTAISYNWSAGNTHVNTFIGPMDAPGARPTFEEQHPGEVLVALIPGNHSSSTVPFPLTGPGYDGLSSSEDD